jgi:hypothetical protein
MTAERDMALRRQSAAPGLRLATTVRAHVQPLWVVCGTLLTQWTFPAMVVINSTRGNEPLRKAWLKGLSPKENRDVPPLDYDLVRRLKADPSTVSAAVATARGGMQHIAVARLAKAVGADRVELYTEPYAAAWGSAGESAQLARFTQAARAATAAGLGINAGHDLNLDNLGAFIRAVPGVREVSIGHALIGDALERGYAGAVQAYLACLRP